MTPNTTYPELANGSKGDPVLWMQEHLASAIPDPGNDRHLRLPDARRRRELPGQPRHLPSGVVEAATWQALLALAPVAVNWTGAGPKG